MSDDDLEILRPVLARFAAGWGASVDCEEGWWPIIAELDRQIAAIAPGYEEHQIKEKFGGLRFYYGAGATANDARIGVLIAQAERVAARTCEVCGALAVLAATGGSGRCARSMPAAASTLSRSNLHRSIRRRSEQVPVLGRGLRRD
jgi:hypothetical protein